MANRLIDVLLAFRNADVDDVEWHDGTGWDADYDYVRFPNSEGDEVTIVMDGMKLISVTII